MVSFHRDEARRLPRMFAAGVGAVALTAGGVLVAAPPAHASVTESVTFSYTGEVQGWVVPAGVSSIDLTLDGASGGHGGGWSGGEPGVGARVQGSIPVVEGEELQIFVGGAGESAYAVEDDDPGYDSVAAGAPGVGGWGWTFGGDGGDGSLLARPGGGGGGSTAVVFNVPAGEWVVAAGGAGGGGRGVLPWCGGGDAGDAGANGSSAPGGANHPELSLPCLAPGVGGLVNTLPDGDGDDGGSVTFLGGGGGGGGAGFSADGLSGGGGGGGGALPIWDDANDETDPGLTGSLDGGITIGLGAGGGGGAGGGSYAGSLDLPAIAFAPALGDGSVTITYEVSHATSTTIEVDPENPIVGDTEIVTVNVGNDTVPGVTPTGTVELFVNGTSFAEAPLVDGAAVFDVGVLDAGGHTLLAQYTPAAETPFEASGASIDLFVSLAETTTTLSVSPSSVVVGGSIVLTATVGATPPVELDGEVVFFAGDVELGSAALIDGQATFTVKPSEAGTLVLAAVYSGGAQGAPSVSESVSVTVTGAVTPVTPSGLPKTGASTDVLPIALAVLGLGLLVTFSAARVRRAEGLRRR